MGSDNVVEFPAISASARLAILVPTVRWDDKTRSVLASLIGVANKDIAVLIADNSENEEKHLFLRGLRDINNNIVVFAHKKNIGAIENFYFLHQWCAGIEFSAIMADDDFVSPTYYADAYHCFLENQQASCISAGTVLVDFGNHQLHNISQPSMVGADPIDRMHRWNGWAARVTMYDVSRRALVEPALMYLKETPLQGQTLLESIFELSRLSSGDFCQIPGDGVFVHYPFHGASSGEGADRFYKLLCEGVGLAFPMMYFVKLSTAVQCAVFLLGKFSPISDEKQKHICAQYVFRHLFFDGFLPDITSDKALSVLESLFADNSIVLAGLKYYSESKNKKDISFNIGIIKWFVEIIKVFQSPAIGDELLLSEKFSIFCADVLGVDPLAIDQAVIGSGLPIMGEFMGGSGDQWTTADWFRDRAPSPSRILALQSLLQASPGIGTIGAVVVVPESHDAQLLDNTLQSLSRQHRQLDQVWLVGGDYAGVSFDGPLEQITGKAAWPRLLSDRIAQGNSPDFLWILYAGDQLLPQATLLLGEYRLRQPDPLVWYVDEAALEGEKPVNPMLKPDFNIDLLRSYPYVGRNLVISSAAIQAVGGLDNRVDELAPIDLIWRLVEQAGPSVVGHIPEVLQLSEHGLMEWVCSAGTMTWAPAVTQAHFVRMGLDAQVRPGAVLGLNRIDYPLSLRPLVSIIVPTRDQLPVLRACVEGLMEHTAYADYELLIVDNGSMELGAVEFLAGLERMGMDRVRVLRWPRAFDFAGMNNFAVQQARGDVLLFLNNDIQFSSTTHSDWLERLLVHVLRPEVGAVGSRLDLPDGRGVEQCGQILGLENSVGAAFRGWPAGDNSRGYMNRLVAQQNVSALSASCLMIRRQVFDELGGFDAESFPIYYADSDLCLKATQAGYLLVVEPDTGLLHMGGATRLLTEKFGLSARPDDEQRDRLYARWLPQLARDPNYHPALGKLAPGFDLRSDASRLFDPLPGRPLPVVMASHGDWHGCGHYRVIQPFKAQEAELRLEGGLKLGDFHFTDVARIQPDVIVLQGGWRNEGILTQIRRYREITGAKVVLEFDDYLPNIPTRSVNRKHFSKGVVKEMRRAIEQVDWLVVSTPELAQEYADFHDDIRVALNGLYPDWWRELSAQRRVGKKMRVGWAGGISHTGDLAEIRSVVNDLQDEVEWVFMGMKPEGVQCEFHPGIAIRQYPAALADLNLDLAIAPLELNQFNRSKSNLRLLELGACGVPVIATDIEPYRGDLPVTLVRNRHQDWVAAIRSHLADPEALARQGDALRAAVQKNWMLEGDFLDQWTQAWGIAPATDPESVRAELVIESKQVQPVGAGRMRQSRRPSVDPETPLAQWLAKRVLNHAQSALLRQHFSKQDDMPAVAVFVLAQDGVQAVEETLSSLAVLCDGFVPTQIIVVGGDAPGQHPGLPQVQHAPAGDMSQTLQTINRFAAEAVWDWMLVVEAGDVFTPAGLALLARDIAGAKDVHAIYADEMVCDATGQLSARLRPDFNLDLLLSAPALMARHWVFRRRLFIEAGGFDPAFEDAAEFDLLLRLIGASGTDGLAHVAEPLLVVQASELETKASEKEALLRHARNRGYEHATVSAHLPGCYRLEYGHQTTPGVSIIIPTRNMLPMLMRCVDSLLEKTAYKNYEVLIVDNGSDEEDACAWLDGIEAMNSPQLRVLRYPHPFNYSAMNNLAASQARGEYLVLLNNDTAVIRADWLDALLNHAQRPEVGVVGAKLLYPNGSIQHAGVVLGLRGPADHIFIGSAPDMPGFMHRLQVDQDYSAVTAACLMIRASLYQEVGGLDEGTFKVSYNDVDLCLKVRQSGHLLVWTPHAVVMHEGSVSQTQVDQTQADQKSQRFRAEQDALYAKWLPLIARDPAYNPLLTLQGYSFGVDTRADFNWRPLSWRPLPVVLTLPADRQGSGHSRVVQPSRAVNAFGLASASISDQGDWLIEAERLAPDTMIFHRQVLAAQLAAQQRLMKFSSCFKVADLDDYLPGLPSDSALRASLPKDILQSMRHAAKLVDRLIVSTEPLAEALKGLHSDIRVVENRLSVEDWSSLASQRRQGRLPRVGWISGLGHHSGLSLMADVVRALADEVEWVFLGDCPDALQPYVHERHRVVSIDAYPAQLASLNLDLALAPMEDTRFNQCTSQQQLLEYGACGYPVVCSDVLPYRGDLPVMRVKPRVKDWVDAIRAHTHDLDAAAKAGDALREAVLRDWMLDESQAGRWLAQWLAD